MATRKQVERRMAELGATFYSEQLNGGFEGGWDVVISAPDGYVFAATESRDLVFNGGSKSEVWEFALEDLEHGLVPDPEPDE